MNSRRFISAPHVVSSGYDRAREVTRGLDRSESHDPQNLIVAGD